MTSVILQTAARFLIPLLVVFSIFTLFRGHNQPGGGFAGGLLAATAFSLYVFAWDAVAARRAFAVDPHNLIGAGLLFALGSALLSLFGGQPFMTGLWAKLPMTEESGLAIGTPVIFDIGVYLVVLGATMLIVTSLAEEQEGRD